jgi:hypothetical protein
MWIDNAIRNTVHAIYYQIRYVVSWVWAELPRALLTAGLVYAALKFLP